MWRECRRRGRRVNRARNGRRQMLTHGVTGKRAAAHGPPGGGLRRKGMAVSLMPQGTVRALSASLCCYAAPTVGMHDCAETYALWCRNSFATSSCRRYLSCRPFSACRPSIVARASVQASWHALLHATVVQILHHLYRLKHSAPTVGPAAAVDQAPPARRFSCR